MKNLLFLTLVLFSTNGWAKLPEKIEKPSLVVYKKKRQMELYSGDKLIKVYRFGLGLNPVPPKKKEGDRATPEGEYQVCGKIPESTYYRGLILNYPNAADADRGLKEGLISKKEYAAIIKALSEKECPNFFTNLGGQVEIHGMGSREDWTWGCIALDNPDIEELYRALPNGTKVSIKP